MSESNCDNCERLHHGDEGLCPQCLSLAQRARAEEREALLSRVEAFFSTATTPELRANVSILLTELRGQAAQPKCAVREWKRDGMRTIDPPTCRCPDCAPKCECGTPSPALHDVACPVGAPKDDARAKALEALLSAMPDARILELADRMVGVGPRLSASEFHEVANWISERARTGREAISAANRFVEDSKAMIRKQDDARAKALAALYRAKRGECLWVPGPCYGPDSHRCVNCVIREAIRALEGT